MPVIEKMLIEGTLCKTGQLVTMCKSISLPHLFSSTFRKVWWCVLDLLTYCLDRVEFSDPNLPRFVERNAMCVFTPIAPHRVDRVFLG